MILAFLSGFFSPTFLITISGIFFASLIIVLLKGRKKDRTLKFFHKFHSVVGMEDGSTMWGIIKVFNNGIEVIYDKPYQSHRSKQLSYMLYNSEVDNLQILIRYEDNMDEEQQERRQKQVSQLINRGYLVRIYRFIANLFNRLKDAIRKTVAVAMGQIYKAKNINRWSSIRVEGERATGEVINTIEDNLYESMLEQHIGKLVAVDIICTNVSTKERNVFVELQGYLAEYSDKFLAIVNIDHPIEGRSNTIKISKDISQDGYNVKTVDDKIVVMNDSKIPLIVENKTDEQIVSKVLLLKGSVVKFKKYKENILQISRIRKIDAIIPRDLAKVRHAIQDKERGLEEAIDDIFSDNDGNSKTPIV